MLKLKEYLSKEGWKKDLEETKKDLFTKEGRKRFLRGLAMQFCSIPLCLGMICGASYLADYLGISAEAVRKREERQMQIWKEQRKEEYKLVLDEVLNAIDENQDGKLSELEQIRLYNTLGIIKEESLSHDEIYDVIMNHYSQNQLKKALEHYKGN